MVCPYRVIRAPTRGRQDLRMLVQDQNSVDMIWHHNKGPQLHVREMTGKETPAILSDLPSG